MDTMKFGILLIVVAIVRVDSNHQEDDINSLRGENKNHNGYKKPTDDALNKFLDKVLKAQNDLKWIDEATKNLNPNEVKFEKYRFQRGSDGTEKLQKRARNKSSRRKDNKDLESLKKSIMELKKSLRGEKRLNKNKQEYKEDNFRNSMSNDELNDLVIDSIEEDLPDSRSKNDRTKELKKVSFVEDKKSDTNGIGPQYSMKRSKKNLSSSLELDNGGSMKERIEATSPAENSGDAKVGNRSRSDYLALKNTDDMFKGGIEQNDLPVEMLPNTTLSFKNLANWQTREKNEEDNIFDPRDLEESFVDGFNWIDYFDDDTKMKFGRRLQTFVEESKKKIKRENGDNYDSSEYSNEDEFEGDSIEDMKNQPFEPAQMFNQTRYDYSPKNDLEHDRSLDELLKLLTVENLGDTSDMTTAVHGELAGKIVELIYDQVAKNDQLKSTLGLGLERKHKNDELHKENLILQQEQDKNELKNTEEMMKKVVNLLGRMVLDEVQKKSCIDLPLDLREFLKWMIRDTPTTTIKDQVISTEYESKNKETYDGNKDLKIDWNENSNKYENVSELRRKVRVMKNLIDQYNALTEKEKTKVQMVHDYLVRQVNLLIGYIEAKEAAESKTPNHHHLMSNYNEDLIRFEQNLVPPLTHDASDGMRLKNEIFNIEDRAPYEDWHPTKVRVTRSSEGTIRNLNGESEESQTGQKGERPEKNGPSPVSTYRNIERKSFISREKSNNWVPYNTNYEEPMTKYFKDISDNRKILAKDESNDATPEIESNSNH